jgi:AcrR family transcriptional regulator
MNQSASSPGRKRAPYLRPEERRASIVDATLRLVEAGSRGITTQDIARETGTAEGTIFRVFVTKEQLLDACIARVLENDPILDDLAAAGAKSTQRQRAIAASDAIRRHMRYIRPIVDALAPLGVDSASPERRGEFIDLLVATVASMLDGRGRKRLLRATIIVHSAFGAAVRDALPNPPTLGSSDIVDLVLND